ncbi:MAG: FHA domain-containing protein [Chthoniobacterales bacterium]|nr:FHA domain-containing protein [Chthoniobacterales bacterium]MBA3762576.1 FHA domain-containing protein [Chthoniobacterales bacterium]
MSKLILWPGGPSSITHELKEELITIGRSPNNVIPINDPSVSGHHAQLHQVGETFHLQDLDSTNGTRVNGEKVTSIALRVGDRIIFGKVEARFEGQAIAEAPPLPVSPEAARPAQVSARPADFANASPFPKRTKDRDPVRMILFAAACVAILALLASMLALGQMHPPTIP